MARGRALRTFLVAAAVLASRAALPGETWTDPDFGELVRSSDAIVECEVIAGGQFEALVAVTGRVKGSTPDEIEVTGFNAYEWNSAYHAMSPGDEYVLFLQKVGDLWCAPTPSAGTYPVDGEYVVGTVAGRESRQEIPRKDFVEAVRALSSEMDGRVPAADAVAVLRPMLGSGAAETRHMTIEFLGFLGAREASQMLAEPLRDDNQAMRAAASRALGRIGGADAAVMLVQALDDQFPDVAREAAVALAHTGEAGFAEPLRKWLDRTAEKVSARSSSKRIQLWVDARVAVLDYVAGKTGDRDVPALERMLASSERAAALAAVAACARLRALQVIPSLMRLAGAEDQMLSRQALGALYVITLNSDVRDRAKLAEWWRTRSGESRDRWVSAALAAARAQGSPPQSAAERTVLFSAVASGSPDAPRALAGTLLSGEGWDDAPIEELRGPCALPILASYLCSPSSTARFSAVKGLRAFVKDHPESAGRVSRLGAPLILDSSTTVAEEAAALLADCGRQSVRWPAAVLVDRMELGGAPEREAAFGAVHAMTGRILGYSASGVPVDRERSLGLWRTYLASTPPAETPGKAKAAGDPAALRRLADRIAADADWQVAATELIAADNRAAAEKALLGAIERAKPEGTPRLAAALALVGSSASEEALRKMIPSEDPMLSAAATLAAGLCGASGLADDLAKLAKSEHQPRMRLAILALGLAGGDACAAKLAAKAASGSPGAPELAAAGMGHLATGQSEVLRSMLAAGGPGGQAALASLVMRGESMPATGAVKAVAAGPVSWDPALAATVAARFDAGSVAALAQLLGSGSRQEREGAAFCLARRAQEAQAALPAARKAIADDSSAVRFYAARIVGTLKDAQSAGALAAMLSDTDSAVRAEATAALGEIGDQRYLTALRSALARWVYADPRSYVALGSMGGLGELEELVRLSKSQTWSEQYYSMEGLSRMSMPAAADRLAEIWLDRESQLQSHAGDCLVRMGRVGAAPAAQSAASQDPLVRLKAVSLLARMNAPEAAAALRSAAADPDARVRRLAARAASSAKTAPTASPRGSSGH